MRPRLPLLAVIVLLGACDPDGTTVLPPPAGGPLIPGTWYIHSADGDTLPALISTRRVGVAEETVRLDSARLVIAADLTYAQRFWTRTFVNTVLDRTDVVLDEGTIVAEGSGFRLVSGVRPRAFDLTVPALGVINTSEQMVFLADSIRRTSGVYRLTRP